MDVWVWVLERADIHYAYLFTATFKLFAMGVFLAQSVKHGSFTVVFLFVLYFLTLSAFPTFNIAIFSLGGSRVQTGSNISQKTPGDPADDYGDYAFLPPALASDFPLPDPERKQYHEWNAKNMRELYVCMAAGTCGKNQRKVALLAAHWFEEAIVRGWRGGEGVW